MRYEVRIEQEVQHDGYRTHEALKGAVDNFEDATVLMNAVLTAFPNAEVSITATNNTNNDKEDE